MLTHNVNDLISTLLLLAAGGLAIPGWLTNNTNQAQRLLLRVLCWIALWLAMGFTAGNEHGWSRAVAVAIGTMWFVYALNGWRKLEAQRQADRRVAALWAAKSTPPRGSK